MSRPILPAPSFAEGGLAREDSSPSGSPADQKRQYAKRGAISKIACRSCRRRKTKCNSEKPTCQNCAARGEACIYDFEESDRSLTALRDNVENLAEERNALETILTTIQTSSESTAVDIYSRLRSGNNLTTVAQHIALSRTSALPQDAIPTTSSIHLSRLDQYEQLLREIVTASANEQEEIIRRLRHKFDPGPLLTAIRARDLLQPLRVSGTPNVMEREYSGGKAFGLVRGTAPQIADSMDIEPDQAPLLTSWEPWTDVTQDPELIDHLFSLYFSWQHTFYQMFPEDLFRADYERGGQDYCSRFLVNAICATGSLLSRRPAVFESTDDPNSAGLPFYRSAQDHLRRAPASSICTVAGLSLLANFEAARGRVSAMWAYSGQSSRMALDLSLHLRNGTPNDENDELMRMAERSKVHTFWGCFITDQVTSFTLGRLPMIPINGVTTQLPPVDPLMDARPWIAYLDGSKPITPGATSSTFREFVSLCKIVNSTLLLFFAPAKDISGSSLVDEYRKYLRWKDNLPAMISATHEAPPHILCAHLLWHAAVLLLFRPFLRVKILDSRVVASDICRQSANAISELFGRHRALYHLQGISSFQIQCLLTACTIHIIHVPAIASTNHLIDACNSLHALVNRNNWAKSSIKIIKGLVKKWDRVLPQAAEEALFQDDPPFGSHFAAASASDKRASHSTPPPSFKLSKRARIDDEGHPQLFAPSASQPAPLLRPIHSSSGETVTESLAYDSMKAEHAFDGLDFSGEDFQNLFYGANLGLWDSVEPN